MDFNQQLSANFQSGWNYIAQLYRPIKLPEKVSLVKNKMATVQTQARQVAEHYARLGDYVHEIKQALSSIPDKFIKEHPEAMFDLYAHYCYACLKWDQTEQLRAEWRELLERHLFPEMVEALFMADQFKAMRKKLLIFDPVSNEEIRTCRAAGVYRQVHRNNYSTCFNQYLAERENWKQKQQKFNENDFSSSGEETDEDERGLMDSNLDANCFSSDNLSSASSCVADAVQTDKSDQKNGLNDKSNVASFAPHIEKAVGEKLYVFVLKASGFDTDTLVIALDSETFYAWSIVGGGDSSSNGNGNNVLTLLVSLLDQIGQVCQRKAVSVKIHGMPGSSTGHLKRYLKEEGIQCLTEEICPNYYLNAFERIKNEFYRNRWFSIFNDHTLGNINARSLNIVTKHFNMEDWYIQPPPKTRIIEKGIPINWLY